MTVRSRLTINNCRRTSKSTAQAGRRFSCGIKQAQLIQHRALGIFSGRRHRLSRFLISLAPFRHHVSQRDDPLRDRLQPRHSRARPRVRIRAVRLTPRRWLDHRLRARSSVTLLLPSSPSSVFLPPRRRRPSSPSLPHVSSPHVAPRRPPLMPSRLRPSFPRRRYPPPFKSSGRRKT